MTGFLISIGYGYYNTNDGYFHPIRGTRGGPTIYANRTTAKRHLELIPEHLRNYCKIVKIVEVAQ